MPRFGEAGTYFTELRLTSRIFLDGAVHSGFEAVWQPIRNLE
jgi:hypothetical protein